MALAIEVIAKTIAGCAGPFSRRRRARYSERAGTFVEPVDVLVTGSLHLVGGVIEVAGLSDVAL